MADGVRLGESRSFDNERLNSTLRGAGERRRRREREGDDVVGSDAAKVEPRVKANGRAHTVAEENQRTSWEVVRRNPGEYPEECRGEYEGENEQAAVDRPASLFDDQQDEREIDRILGHARCETRDREHAEGALLEQWEG